MLPTKGTAPKRTVVEGPAVPDASKTWASISSVNWPAPLTEQVFAVPNLHLEVLNSLWQPSRQLSRMIRLLQELIMLAKLLFPLLSLLHAGFTERLTLIFGLYIPRWLRGEACLALTYAHRNHLCAAE